MHLYNCTVSWVQLRHLGIDGPLLKMQRWIDTGSKPFHIKFALLCRLAIHLWLFFVSKLPDH